LQLVLSFGHTHPGKIAGGFPGATAGAHAQAARPIPAPQPADDADDYCAICASIYLAASSFAPEAPRLPVPTASCAVEHVDCIAAVFIAPRRAPFQSRAPPLA